MHWTIAGAQAMLDVRKRCISAASGKRFNTIASRRAKEPLVSLPPGASSLATLTSQWPA